MSSPRPDDDYTSLAKQAWGTPATSKVAGYKPRKKTSGIPEYDDLYEAKGKQYDVDPDLLLAQGRQESQFKPRARSKKNAAGLAQFMPGTAKEFGVDVNDPASSVDGQARLMRQLLDRTGDINLSLAGYNSGHNYGTERLRRNAERIPETRDYIAKITGEYNSSPPEQDDNYTSLAKQAWGQSDDSRTFLKPGESLAGDQSKKGGGSIGTSPTFPGGPQRVDTSQVPVESLLPTDPAFVPRVPKEGESYYDFEKTGRVGKDLVYAGNQDGVHVAKNRDGDIFKLDETAKTWNPAGPQKRAFDTDKNEYELAPDQEGVKEGEVRRVSKGNSYIFGADGKIRNETAEGVLGLLEAKSAPVTQFPADGRLKKYYEKERKNRGLKDSEALRQKFIKAEPKLKTGEIDSVFTPAEDATLETIATGEIDPAAVKQVAQDVDMPGSSPIPQAGKGEYGLFIAEVDPNAEPGKDGNETAFRQAATQFGKAAYGRDLTPLEVEALVGYQKASRGGFAFSRKDDTPVTAGKGLYYIDGASQTEYKAYLDSKQHDIANEMWDRLSNFLAQGGDLDEKARSEFVKLGFDPEQLDQALGYNPSDSTVGETPFTRGVAQKKQQFQKFLEQYMNDPDPDVRNKALPAARFEMGWITPDQMVEEIQAYNDLRKQKTAEIANQSNLTQGGLGPWDKDVASRTPEQQQRDVQAYLTQTITKYGSAGNRLKALKQEEIAETARQSRIAQMSWPEYLGKSVGNAVMTIPKTAVSIAIASSLRGIALASKAIDDLPAPLRTFINPFSVLDSDEARARPASKRGTYEMAESLDHALNYILPTDRDMQQEFLAGKLPQGIGSTLGMIVGGWSKIPRLGIAVMSTLQMGGDGYKEALEGGATEEQAQLAGMLQAPLGITEIVGMGSILSRLNSGAGSGLWKRLWSEAWRAGAREIPEEISQEGFQSTAGNIIKKLTYDPDRRWDKDVFDSMLVAGVAAPIASAGITALNFAKNRMAIKRIIDQEQAAGVIFQHYGEGELYAFGKPVTVTPEMEPMLARHDFVREQIRGLQDQIGEIEKSVRGKSFEEKREAIKQIWDIKADINALHGLQAENDQNMLDQAGITPPEGTIGDSIIPAPEDIQAESVAPSAEAIVNAPMNEDGFTPTHTDPQGRPVSIQTFGPGVDRLPTITWEDGTVKVIPPNEINANFKPIETANEPTGPTGNIAPIESEKNPDMTGAVPINNYEENSETPSQTPSQSAQVAATPLVSDQQPQKPGTVPVKPSAPTKSDTAGKNGKNSAAQTNAAAAPNQSAPIMPKALPLEQQVTPAVTGEPKKTTKYSNVQIPLSKEQSEPITKFRADVIDKADVADKADLPSYAKDGLAITPHVTVKYGLKTNDPADISNLFEGEKPITVTLGKTSVFPGAEKGNYDVLIAEIDSPELHGLNKKVSDKADVAEGVHPEYKPHVTIAYLKKGAGAKYAGRSDFEGQAFTYDGVTFSPANKSGKVNIPFQPQPQYVALPDSLDIPRSEMPQVGRRNMEEFIAFAEDRGTVVTPDRVKASELKPSQNEYNPAQAAQLPKEALDKPITISSDNRVLDGHNTLMRLKQDDPDRMVNVRRIDLPALEAIGLMRSFPKTTYKPVGHVGTSDQLTRTQPDQDIVNPIDRQASQEEKTKQLQALTEQNKPIVEKILAQFREMGLTHADPLGKNNEKDFDEIINKANRAEIKAKKPWFDVEHIRDAFRFRAGFSTFDQIPQMAKIIKDAGIEFVKVDTDKFLTPGPWGWRPVALDLVMPNGQLVEFYTSFSQMIDAQYSTSGRHPISNHGLFELWRNSTEGEIEARRSEMRADQEESRRVYDAAYDEGTQAAGFKNGADIEASFTKAVRSLGSVTDIKSSSNSVAEGMPSDQTPSGDLRMDGEPSTATNADLSERPLQTQGSAIETPSNESVAQNQGDLATIKEIADASNGQIIVAGVQKPAEKTLSAAEKKRIAEIEKELVGLSGAMTNAWDAGASNVGEYFYPKIKALEEERDKIRGYRTKPGSNEERLPLEKPDFAGTVNTDAITPENIDQIEAMFDKPKADKPTTEPTKPSTSDIFKDLVKEKAKPDELKAAIKQNADEAAASLLAGAKDAAKGLKELFGGDKFKSAGFPAFDDEMYAQAKPYFVSAFTHFKSAGKSVRELLSTVIDFLQAEGMTWAEILNMEPYIVRFVDDVEAGEIVLPESTIGSIKEEGQENVDSSNNSDLGTDVQSNNGLGGTQDVRTGDENAAGDLAGGQSDQADSDGQGGNSNSGSSQTGGQSGPGSGSESGSNESTSTDVRDPANDGDTVAGPVRNFRITNELDFGSSFSPKKRFQANITALEVLKTLEDEKRAATPAEQKILAQYVGWGGLPQAFNNSSGWEDENKRLRGMLTDEEYEAARSSTQDSHYTSKTVADGLWNAAKQFGFKGGVVLETSMGIGNFFGLRPSGMRTQLNGVERDPLTARIAKALYPNADIYNRAFEDYYVAPESVDLVIGNPPFGKKSVVDLRDKELSKLKIHAYFIAKGINSLRPGGMLGVVVSKGFLDSSDAQAQAARKYVADRATFVGAIRLPNSAFKANANTEVTTDLVFFQKKGGLKPGMETVDASKLQVGDEIQFRGERWKVVAKAKRDISLENTDADSRNQQATLWSSAGNVERFGQISADVEHTDTDWLGTTEIADEETGDPIRINNYFAENPHMMLGDMTLAGSMYGPNQPALIERPDADLEADIANALEQLPSDIFTDQSAPMVDRLEKAERKSMADYPNMIPYSYGINDKGEIYQLHVDMNGNVSEQPVVAAGKALERVTAMVGLRNLTTEYLAKQGLEDTTDADLEPIRQELNTQYDAFVKKHGYINDDANKRVFRQDPQYALIQSLEAKYDKGVSPTVAKKEGVQPRAASAQKADILNKRTNYPVRVTARVDNAQDALMMSMINRGVVDLDYMRGLYGNKTDDEITNELGNLVYFDPKGESWVPKDEYLSGDVKTKLAEAEESAQQNKALGRNVEALQEVQPQDVRADQIFTKLGTNWIPFDVYQTFISDLLGGQLVGEYSKVLGRFTGIKVTGANPVLNTDRWGTQRASAARIFDALMSNRNPVVRDPHPTEKDKYVINQTETTAAVGKADEMREEFINWIWKDADRRKRLVDQFNDQFNRMVQRKYDGSHYIDPETKIALIPGLSRILQLRPHILNAVARIIQKGKALIDHVVGAGKTPLAITAGMEMRRLGLAKKPMYVVPNHLVDQWAQEFKKFYPGAKVLAATRKDFQKDKRNALFAKIATGDWDAVVVAHSSFTFIPVPREVEAAFIGEQMAEILAAIKIQERQALAAGARKKPRSLKDLEKLRDKLKDKLKRLRSAPRDNLIDFNGMGVDALFVDEAHKYKNLFFTTQKQGISGLGDTKGSQRAFDMFMKTQMVLKRNDDRNVVFLTGTPVSNSLSEIFHMQRYLQNNLLKQRELHTFDAWANAFANDVNDWQLNAAGQLIQRIRFSNFANLPELKQMWQDVTDSITRDDLIKAAEERGEKFPIPKVRIHELVSEPTVEQREYIGVGRPQFDENNYPILDTKTGQPRVTYDRNTIIFRLENWMEIQQNDDPKENVLRITTHARQAGLDMRVIDPSAPDRPGSKLNKAAEQIAKIHAENEYRKGTQLVFLDIASPKGKSNQAQPVTLGEALLQLGVDPDTIIDEHPNGVTVDFTKLPANITDEQKKRLYKIYDDERAAKRSDDAGDDSREEVDEDAPLNPDDVYMSTSGFDAYDDLRQKLIKGGVPANEIAFIHDYNSDDQKASLFAKVNRGEIRVLLGSTPKMGEGMNVQKKLVALHNLDATWKPSDYEQRTGRIIRQGNEFYEADPDNFTVDLFNYATKFTYDARMWELNEQKGLGIDRFRNSADDVRELEDISPQSATAAEMKAAAAGDPRLLQVVQLQSDVRKLESQSISHARGKADLQEKIEQFELENTPVHHSIKRFQEAKKLADANPKTEDTALRVGNGQWTINELRKDESLKGSEAEKNKKQVGALRKQVEAAIYERFERAHLSGVVMGAGTYLGTYRGFKLSVLNDGFRNMAIYLMNPSSDRSYIKTVFNNARQDAAERHASLSGVLTRLDNMVDGFQEDIDRNEKVLATQQKEIEDARKTVNEPFAKRTELEEKKVQLAELNRDLHTGIDFHGDEANQSMAEIDEWNTDVTKIEFMRTEHVRESDGDPVYLFRVHYDGNKNPSLRSGPATSFGMDEKATGFVRNHDSGVLMNQDYGASLDLNESGMSRKLDTSEMDEGDAMTAERMFELANAPLETVIDEAEFEQTGDRIFLSPGSHELYRRTLEQVRFEEGSLNLNEAEDAEDLFKGQFIPPKRAAAMQRVLREKAQEALQKGYGTKIRDAFTKHADALRDAAKDNRTVIMYVFAEAIPEEMFHQADYLGAADKSILNRHTALAKDKLDKHNVRKILWEKHFAKFKEYRRQDERLRNATLRAEIPPFLLSLSESQLSDLGITPDERADYLLTWFEGYAEKNGIESLNNFDGDQINVQNFIQRVKQAQTKQDAQPSPGNVGNSGQQNTESGTAPPKDKGSDRQGNESEQYGQDASEFFGLGKGQKWASLPATLRRAGIDIDDMARDVFGDAPALESARKMLNENGIEGTIKLLDQVGQLDVDHAMASFMIQRMLMNRAAELDATDPQEAENLRAYGRQVGAKHVLNSVAAGRFTRAASVIPHSVEGVVYSFNALINDKTGGERTISPEKWIEIENLGRELEEKDAKLQAAISEGKAQKRKIKRLEDELEGKGKKKRRRSGSIKNRKQLVAKVKEEKQANVDTVRARLKERFGDPASGEITQKSVLAPSEFSLKSALEDEADFPIDDFAEVGAMMLTEGIAGDVPYLPEDFKAEMQGEYGDAILPYFQEIYKAAWEKRDAWLREIRKEEQADAIRSKFGEDLEDWEVEEIIGQNKEKAAKRRAMENIHKLSSEGKGQKPGIDDMRRIIAEIAPDTGSAVIAVVIAEGGTTADIAEAFDRLDVEDGAKRREIMRKATDVVEKAKLARAKERSDLANEVLQAKGDLKDIEDLRWTARNDVRKTQQKIADEMRRIKNGELSYKWSQLLDASQVMRTMMASLDMSAGLRQGGFFAFAKPEAQGKAFLDMFKSIQEKGYGRVITDIENQPLFVMMQRAGIDFAMAGKSESKYDLMGEELFRGEAMIEKIPLLGKLVAEGIVKPSERTYTAMLDSQRAIMANIFFQDLMASGLTISDNPAEFRKIADFINVATGRGTIPRGNFGKILMNLPLFAPRYTLSRLQLINMTLNPVAYARMPAAARKIVAKQAFRFYGTTGAVLGLVSAFGYMVGASVNWDDDDSDYLKIKIGNAHYDIFAGMLPPAKLLIKIVHSAIRTKFGTDNRLSGEFGWDIANTVGRFLRGKLSPMASLAWDYGAGEDYIGKKFELWGDAWYKPGKAIYSRFIPLTIGDAIEAYKLDGVVGIAKSTPAAFFGLGVSTYKARAEQPETEAEKLAAKMKSWGLRDDEDPDAADNSEQYKLKSELIARARRGEDISADLADAKEKGLIDSDGAKSIMARAKKTLLEDKASGLSLWKMTKVLEIASPSERAELLPIVNQKMKSAEIKGSLTPVLRKKLEDMDARISGHVDMPDKVKDVFDQFELNTPDVGQNLVLEKGADRTKLTEEQYNKYRKETLERIYGGVEEVLNDRDYKEAESDAEREKMIKKAISKARAEEQKETKDEMLAKPAKLADLVYGRDGITNDTGIETTIAEPKASEAADQSPTTAIQKELERVLRRADAIRLDAGTGPGKGTDMDTERAERRVNDLMRPYLKVPLDKLTPKQQTAVKEYLPKMRNWKGQRQSENVIDMR